MSRAFDFREMATHVMRPRARRPICADAMDPFERYARICCIMLGLP